MTPTQLIARKAPRRRDWYLAEPAHTHQELKLGSMQYIQPKVALADTHRIE